jgi:hypothetical protein
LELTGNKPILSNESIISAAEAEKFPTLAGLNCLNDEVVDIPDFFTRNNREFGCTSMQLFASRTLKNSYLFLNKQQEPKMPQHNAP